MSHLDSLCSALWPLIGILIFLVLTIGLYLISKGVDRNFNLLQTSLGYVFLLFGLLALAISIIHGHLLPAFLTVSENVSASPGIDVSATC